MSILAMAAVAVLTAGDGGVAPFAPGEELAYDVTVLGAEAGTLRIDVGAPSPMDGTEVWPVVAVVQTTGPFDHVFSVRDRLVTWLDPLTHRAVASRITASEGSNRYGHFMHFHRGAAVDAGMPVDVEHWDGKHTSTASRTLDPDAEDFLAAVFWLRRLPLAPKEVDSIPIFMGQDNLWRLVATVVGTEPVELPSGSVRCAHVRLSAQFAGPLGNKRDLDAYFTDDPSHVPVVLDSELFIGHMRARLSHLPN